MSETTAPERPTRLSGLALTGLLLGLAAPFTLVTGPLALYFSYRGLYAVNAGNGRLLGRGAALTGLVLGGLTTVLGSFGVLALTLTKARSVEARVACTNNLRVVGVAVRQYAEDHDQTFPRAVAPLADVPPSERASWQAGVLPYLNDQGKGVSKWQSLAGRLDLEKPWADAVNAAALTTFVPFYQCPSNPDFDPNHQPGSTNYVGVTGIGDDAALLPSGAPRAGFFGYERSLSILNVQGSGHKMMVLETAWHNGPWIAGGEPTVRGVGFETAFLAAQAATLVGMQSTPEENLGASFDAILSVARPPEPSLIGEQRPFGGLHTGGLNVLCVDGSVRFVADTIDPRTFRLQATLADSPEIFNELP